MAAAVGWYCVIVGALMVAWWGLEVHRGVLARPDRARAEIGLHLVGEASTAVVLLVAGVRLVSADHQELALVGLGMLLYTVVVSPGYFLARRELPPVVMFGVLVVATLGAITTLLVT